MFVICASCLRITIKLITCEYFSYPIKAFVQHFAADLVSNDDAQVNYYYYYFHLPHLIVIRFNLVSNLDQCKIVLLQFVGEDDGSSDDEGMLCE